MPSIKPIRRGEFEGKYWKPILNFTFAAKDTIVPLTGTELSKACLTRPVALFRRGEQFVFVAVQGFEPQKNLLVMPDGKWLGGYIPAAYRGYPFAIAQDQNGKEILCIDEDSGLINESEGQPFFDESGEATKTLKDLMQFLMTVRQDALRTQKAVDAIQAAGLIKEWSIKLGTGDDAKALKGFFKVDEQALNDLDPEQFEELRQKGALPLIYSHLISLQHMKALAQLAQKRAEIEVVPDIEELFGEKDDSISFDFDNL